MSTPEMPSTSAWWVFESIAKRSPSRPSTSQISQSGLSRSSCWANTRPASALSCSSEPGAGQRGGAHVVAKVQVRVVDPLRAALGERHEREPLAVARHQPEAALDRLEQLVVGRGRALEDHHAGHVHVGGAVLQMEERGVEPCQTIRGHGSKTRSERQAELVVRQRRCADSSSSPATRTPRRRTGRRGSRRRSSSSATVPTVLEVVHGRVEAAGARDGREVVEADLDADRAAAPLLARERLAELAGEALEHRLELGEAAQVAVEGGLARLRLRDPHRLDACARPRSGRARRGGGRGGRRTTARAARRAWRRAGRACAMPSCSRRATVLGPMPGTRPGEASAKRSRASSARQLHEAVGLLGVRGDLRDQLVRADPDRAGEARSPPARPPSRAGPPSGSGRAR